MSRETGTDRYALLILCIQQGANEKLLYCPEATIYLGALWCPMRRKSRKRGYTYVIHFAVQ